jgi:hypothetical protein
MHEKQNNKKITINASFFLNYSCHVKNHRFNFEKMLLIKMTNTLNLLVPNPHYFPSRRGRDRIVDGLTNTYIISAYHH